MRNEGREGPSLSDSVCLIEGERERDGERGGERETDRQRERGRERKFVCVTDTQYLLGTFLLKREGLKGEPLSGHGNPHCAPDHIELPCSTHMRHNIYSNMYTTYSLLNHLRGALWLWVSKPHSRDVQIQSDKYSK